MIRWQEAEGPTALNFLDSLSAVERKALISVARERMLRPAVTVPRPSLSGENCTVILTDMVGFGANARNDRDRQVIRDANLKMMQTSLGHLWDYCVCEDRGDGLLIVAPGIPTATIMERLHRVLPGELWRHNRNHEEPARIRLRLAADVGPVANDTVGLAGEAIIGIARMLEAPVLKDAMTIPSVSLGLIVSPFVYDRVIRHADGWTDPGAYEPVDVHVKETRTTAWMQLVYTPRRRLAEGLWKFYL